MSDYFFAQKDQKYQQKCTAFYNIHATKQTLLLTVGGFDIYCETKIIFKLPYCRE